jgi:hypothetical protein
VEEEDVEEAFINGKHRVIEDPEYDYEEERRMNKIVKERLSQLGLSPQTLKNKQRQLPRNLESKLIAKCAQQKTLERPPKKIATANPKCSGANSKSTRGGKSGGNDETKTKRGGNGGSRGGRVGIKGGSRGGAQSSRANK